MKLEARLRKLEARASSDPIVLHFTDGSTREIRGRGDYLLDLFAGAIGGGDLSPRQAEHVDLILGCVSAKEPSGGHMIELLRALLDSPTALDDTDANLALHQ